MATYEMRLAPDPSSPTGFSLQYVYVPSTPVERAQAQIGEIARGLGRQLGLTGRYIAEGTAGTVGIVTNPLAAMGAAATGDMQNFVPLQEQVSRGLTALGVPEPRGAVEESVAGLSRAVAGAGGVAGAARAAIPVATGAVGRGTLTELAAMPGRQLAAGATGEGARQLAEAGGAGPIGQTLAAVGGGAIPFAGAPTTAASLVGDLSAAYRPGSVVRSGAGPVPPPPPRGPSPFDYVAVEAAARERNQLRPFETAEPLPAPATYDEAVQQVADLRAQLADADRNVRLSTSIQNPARAGLRSLDQRAVLERQLAAAEGHLARLRPAAPERQNAPGTSEAARAYLERLGMGRVADLGSTRAAELEPLAPVQAEEAPVAFDWASGGGSKQVTQGGATLTYGVARDGKSAEIILIKTPKEQRGRGNARRLLEQFVSEADAQGLQLRLNADPMDKGVTKSGLERFYKSLGFVRNAGRQKDFTTQAEYIRNPRTD